MRAERVSEGERAQDGGGPSELGFLQATEYCNLVLAQLQKQVRTLKLHVDGWCSVPGNQACTVLIEGCKDGRALVKHWVSGWGLQQQQQQQNGTTCELIKIGTHIKVRKGLRLFQKWQ